jgi:hypothetical protein
VKREKKRPGFRPVGWFAVFVLGFAVRGLFPELFLGVAEEIEFRAADLHLLDHLDLGDGRHAQREDPLHADAAGDLADGDGGAVLVLALLGDEGAFEDLDALTLVAFRRRFLDFLVDANDHSRLEQVKVGDRFDDDRFFGRCLGYRRGGRFDGFRSFGGRSCSLFFGHKRTIELINAETTCFGERLSVGMTAS